MKRNVAKKITGDSYNHIINRFDIRDSKKNIVVQVDERESILLQYYLFEHGWSTVTRTHHKNKPWKLKSIRKNKFKFESVACTSIRIMTDGTFFSPTMGSFAHSGEMDINIDVMLEILDMGYCEVEG